VHTPDDSWTPHQVIRRLEGLSAALPDELQVADVAAAMPYSGEIERIRLALQGVRRSIAREVGIAKALATGTALYGHEKEALAFAEVFSHLDHPASWVVPGVEGPLDAEEEVGGGAGETGAGVGDAAEEGPLWAGDDPVADEAGMVREAGALPWDLERVAESAAELYRPVFEDSWWESATAGDVVRSWAAAAAYQDLGGPWGERAVDALARMGEGLAQHPELREGLVLHYPSSLAAAWVPRAERHLVAEGIPLRLMQAIHSAGSDEAVQNRSVHSLRQELATGIKPAEAAAGDPDLVVVQAFCGPDAEPTAVFSFEPGMHPEDICERVFSILSADPEDLVAELQWAAELPPMGIGASVVIDGHGYYYDRTGWIDEDEPDVYDADPGEWTGWEYHPGWPGFEDGSPDNGVGCMIDTAENPEPANPQAALASHLTGMDFPPMPHPGDPGARTSKGAQAPWGVAQPGVNLATPTAAPGMGSDLEP
jgi:hypothetical protein